MKVINNVKNFFEKLFGLQDVVMYTRVKKIYNYFERCVVTSDRLQILDEARDGVQHSIHFEFKSNLGPVRIVLDKVCFGYVYYTLDYSNYAGSTVFKMKVCPSEVEIEPMLGENLTAKDIDLAIYELEQYLLQFGDISAILNALDAKMDMQIKIHEKECKKLETGNFE